MVDAGDPIKHVIVLILENRSFDQMLGCFTSIYPDMEGVRPGSPRVNLDPRGAEYAQSETTERIMFLDPQHEVEHVAVQLENSNGGFVRDFATEFPDSTTLARSYIMGYFPLGFLPGLHALAREFTICDHWFSSLPGPTWPNRFFALSGTSLGRVNMPGDATHRADVPGYFQQTQSTIFDRLNEAAIDWKIYFHDIPQTTVLANLRKPHNSARYFYVDEFFDDARGSEKEFPEFSFIEPDYLGFGQSDDHPPHDIMRAEKLIADVYNAIRANDALWKSSLLVIFFDEHGGFYDHVVPPAAVAPDEHKEEYTFDRLGVRVPAVLVSPWVDARVDSTQYDHASLLKYLIEKWHLGPLGRRAETATSIARGILRQTPRNDTIARIELDQAQLNSPDPELEEKAFGSMSEHQKALAKLSEYLEQEGVELAPRGWSAIARALERLKALIEHALERAYGLPKGIRVSISEPDKLAQQKDSDPRDRVARFLMRKKRYAAIGLRDRLKNNTLSREQRDQAVRTLALIAKRKFHNEPPDTKVDAATRWLTSRLT